MEDWITIRNLKKRNPKMGTRTIAKQLNLSRNAVRNALRSEDPPEYKRKAYTNPELKPFQEYITEQYFVKKLKGSRVLNDLHSKGCNVSSSAFYRYIQQYNTEFTQAYMRYETKPGEQGQFDWSPYTVMIEGKPVIVQVFCLILGYSRYRTYMYSLSQTRSSVFEAIEEGLNRIGGVPERIQTDNHATLYNAKKKEWNPGYFRFASHFGFQPSRSEVRHPWSKGKVENPFSFLENHFIADNEFESLDDFSLKLLDFEKQVNHRIHTTTKKTPYLFSWEKVPGNDSGRLIKFLMKNFNIEWIKAAKINKNDDGKTIRITNDTNFLSLTLNNEKNNVNLEIDDGRTDKFFVKTENDELNIYKTPIELFNAEEIAVLFPLPKNRFIGVSEEFRKVSSDCLISVDGNRYSVPHIFSSRDVWIRISQGIYLEVYSQSNKLIAKHTLERTEKGKIFMNKEHFQGYRGTKGTWNFLSQQFLTIAPGQEDFLKKLKAQKRINPSRHLTIIVEAAKHFRKKDVKNVIRLCDKYNVYRSDLFVDLLHQNSEPILIPKLEQVNDLSILSPPGVIRSLDSYCTENFVERSGGDMNG